MKKPNIKELTVIAILLFTVCNALYWIQKKRNHAGQGAEDLATITKIHEDRAWSEAQAERSRQWEFNCGVLIGWKMHDLGATLTEATNFSTQMLRGEVEPFQNWLHRETNLVLTNLPGL